MDSSPFYIAACLALFFACCFLGMVVLVLKRRLITRGEFDKSEASIDEWKRVTVQVLLTSERNAAVAAKTAQVIEQVTAGRQSEQQVASPTVATRPDDGSS